MKYNYFLFDLDNCLLYIPNSKDYFDNILFETLKQSSTKHIPERSERNKFWFSGNGYIDYLKKWGTNNVHDFWKCFDEIDFEYRKILVQKNELLLFDDVQCVLEEIYDENKKLAIISNSADYIVDFIVKKFNISKYFNYFFGLSFDKDQSIAKPSPLGVLSVLEKLKYDPKKEKAIMIGDSIVDVYAAKKANISACLIRRDKNKYRDGYGAWEYNPDFVIEQLNEILNF